MTDPEETPTARVGLFDRMRTFGFWESNRFWVWFIGLLLRILSTPCEMTSFDYVVFRLPIAQELAEGKGLYSDVVYDQMPIYPYITALAILIVGTENKVLTAMAIKLPLAVADALIPVVLYRLGKKLEYNHAGLLASLTYALNPMSFHEIALAHWDSVVTLLVLLAFCCLIDHRPCAFGLLISLGFLTKEYPLFLFGVALVHWRNDLLKLVQAGVSFMLLTVSIVAAVMMPWGTTWNEVADGLSSHPIYQDDMHNPVRDGVLVLRLFIDITFAAWISVWAVLFLVLVLLPMWFYVKKGSDCDRRLMDVVVVHVVMLSTFFCSMHSQFMMWLLPWALLWGFRQWEMDPVISRKSTISALFVPVAIVRGYSLRKMSIIAFGDTLITMAGFWILISALRSLARGQNDTGEADQRRSGKLTPTSEKEEVGTSDG